MEHLIIVTPYIDIRRWTKVRTALSRAKTRGLNIEFYLRETTDPTESFLADFTDSIYLVPYLNAKLYLSEKAAVFTSMNLVEVSDSKSTDIGYYSEEKTSVEELHQFVTTYLDPVKLDSAPRRSEVTNAPIQKPSVVSIRPEELHRQLGRELPKAGPMIEWRDAKTYWFSPDVVNGCDVMVSESLVLKFYRSWTGTSRGVPAVLTFLSKNYGNKVAHTVKDSHPKYVYVDIEFVVDCDLALEISRLVLAIRILMFDY